MDLGLNFHTRDSLRTPNEAVSSCMRSRILKSFFLSGRVSTSDGVSKRHSFITAMSSPISFLTSSFTINGIGILGLTEDFSTASIISLLKLYFSIASSFVSPSCLHKSDIRAQNCFFLKFLQVANISGDLHVSSIIIRGLKRRWKDVIYSVLKARYRQLL